MSGWTDVLTKSIGSLGSVAGSLSAYDQEKDNAKVMKAYKNNALRESENQAFLKRKEYAQIAGSQKAGIGASGVDVNEGSAVEALAATDADGEVNARQIEHAGKMSALDWEIREKSAKQKQRMALINGGITTTGLWQQNGLQTFWDGYRKSGGTRTLGDF